MSTISAFWGRSGASLWVRVLIGVPITLGVLLGVTLMAVNLGALDRFPWPQQLVFSGDKESFIACFEARAEIARRDNGTLVTRFSSRPEGSNPMLIKMGGFIGQSGTRSVEIVPKPGGFTLRDRHYLPDHSPLSQPMAKTDWLMAWRCGTLAG